METKINILDGCQRELEITLTEAELAPHYENAYKKIQPKISMQGFRKGKVPLALVKKHYGEGIKKDAQSDIVNDTFGEVVEKENIRVIGTPFLTKTEPTDNGIKFILWFEVLPEVDLADYRGLSIEEPVHSVGDEEIEAEMKKIQKSYGKLEEADQATDEDHAVSLRVKEIDNATGKPAEDAGAQEMTVFLDDPNAMPELRQTVLNSKAGDILTFTPPAIEGAEAKDFQLEVTKVEKIVPAEITQEFVENYTKGKLSSEEDLKEELGYEMQDIWDRRTRQSMENQVVTQLIQMHDFPLPSTLINEVKNNIFQDFKKRNEKSPGIKNVTMNQMNHELEPVAIRTVKWELIKNRIVEKEKIKVEDYDLDQKAEKEAKYFNADKEVLKNIYMGNEEIMNSILTKKVFDLVLDFAVTEETEFNHGDHHHPKGESFDHD